jgi:Peptidase A4 family
MLRRWRIPLTTLALVFGSMLAAGSASAAVTARHPAPARGITPGGLMVRPGGQAAGPSARGVRHQDESTNWSGYAATGGTGAFHSVAASWIEPTGHCTSRRSARYSSFWVGLDGFNSNSVEQTGTDVDCSGTTPVYYGWYEMFPAAPVNYSNTVRPGDHFSASVTFSGTSTYTLVLTDSTRGWTHTTTKSESGLARSSAEVITEAPSSSSGVLPLADFGTVSYSTSTANGTSLGTQNPTEIIMIDNSGRDKDSTSAIGSGGAFSNTWIRSN